MAYKKRIFLIMLFILINAIRTNMPETGYAEAFALRAHAPQSSEMSKCPMAKEEDKKKHSCHCCNILESDGRPRDDGIVCKSLFTCVPWSESEGPYASWDLNSEVLGLSRGAQRLLEDPLFYSGLILYACSTLLTMLLTHYGILKHFLFTVMIEQLKGPTPCVSPWNRWLEELDFQYVLLFSFLLIYWILMKAHTNIYILNVILPTVLNRSIMLVNRLHYCCVGYIRPQTIAQTTKYLSVFIKIPQTSAVMIPVEKINLLIEQDIAAETRRIREKAKIRRKKRKTMLDDLLDFPFWKTIKSRLLLAYALFKVDYSDVLHRTASFRGPFHVRCITTERQSVLQMAENGFYYPGSGDAVQCAGCGFTVTLEEIRSDLSEPQYHHGACCYALIDGNDEATGNSSTNQLGIAEREHRAYAQAPSQPSGVLVNGGASGDDNQSAPEAAGSINSHADSPRCSPKSNFSSLIGDSPQLSPRPTTRFGQSESTPPAQPIVAPSSSSVTESRAAQADRRALEQTVTAAELIQNHLTTAATTESTVAQVSPSTAVGLPQTNTDVSDFDDANAAAGQSERYMLLATDSASIGYSANAALTNDVSKGESNTCTESKSDPAEEANGVRRKLFTSC